jgi:hypothetical protein
MKQIYEQAKEQNLRLAEPNNLLHIQYRSKRWDQFLSELINDKEFME